MPAFDPSSPFALFENVRAPAGEPSSLLFSRPLNSIVVRDAADLDRALGAIDAHRAAGRFACGYLTYETGYFLLGPGAFRLSKIAPGALPLLSFFVFARCDRLDSVAAARALASAGGDRPCAVHSLELSEDEERYRAKIARIQGYIGAGDTYQVNYTLKQRFAFEGHPASLYRELRDQQTVEYAAFLSFPEVRVLSLSPELFVRKQGARITSKPMKGTAPRGPTPAEDLAIARALRDDPKTRAENLMIVDLLRSDIGRIATPGSVGVRDLFEVQTFETLHQVVSTVEGAVPPELGAGDALRALLPCGSITGAPKRRTMQIIEELENEPRGVYTGAVGFALPDGDFVFNVPIRTVVSTEEGRGELGLGSGILHEADAGAEYAECLLKGRFLTGVNAKFELIESLRYTAGEAAPDHLERHLDRLARSARFFGFACDRGRVAAAVREALPPKSEGAGVYKVRLLLAHDGRVSVAPSAVEETAPGPRWVVLAEERIDSRSVFQRHKTTMRAHYERAYERAAAGGAYEVLFLNEHGELAEATRHNVFLERGAELLTPPLGAGALDGVLRRLVLDDPGKRAREATLTLKDVARADRIFLTNAVRGMVEVQLR